MKYINRKMLKVSVILQLIGFALALVCIFTNSYASPAGYAALAALITGLGLNQVYARCPHCGRFVQGISPFRDTPGLCPKCKGKMEFDK